MAVFDVFLVNLSRKLMIHQPCHRFSFIWLYSKIIVFWTTHDSLENVQNTEFMCGLKFYNFVKIGGGRFPNSLTGVWDLSKAYVGAGLALGLEFGVLLGWVDLILVEINVTNFFAKI